MRFAKAKVRLQSCRESRTFPESVQAAERSAKPLCVRDDASAAQMSAASVPTP